MADNKGVSLRPSTFVEGGFLEDADVTLRKCRFAMWDYRGTQDAVPALVIQVETEDGASLEQCWSAGRATDWAPSEDGKRLIPIGSASSLRSNSNLAAFLESLVEAGFNEEDLGDDISVLDGLRVHLERQAAPKLPGLPESERERTRLVVTKILESKGADKEASDIEARATEALMEILGEHNYSIKRAQIMPLIAKKLGREPQAAEIAKMAFSAKFLSEGPWEYDPKKGTVSVQV